ncbi:hypothetical protein JIN84_21160 [Luteolibacter yonseiensis]|uniref:Uncharacterized protein n=1 Tax=Luteolibacter yonseiensis TaxID=1144680 RepID=A0A934R8J0_9BACT|nr:hypothetical protein [Luteolibacter yonseiensis]MBK1818146.1 hypothetical protein [Luteolibacter yonseiensis]
MSNIGIQEWIVISITLGLLLMPVAVVLGFALFMTKRRKKHRTPPPIP